MVICLGRGADLSMAQLMQLSLTLSCSSKSRFVLPEWFCFSVADLPTLSWKKWLLNKCSSSGSGSSSSRIQEGHKTVVCVYVLFISGTVWWIKLTS